MLDIYVINLEERKDRWEHIVKTFGNDFNLVRVDGIKYNPGNIGCFMSHQKCIQYAKDNKLNNIIVMEDDCIKNPAFLNNFTERLNNIKNFLNNYDQWDIFLGGCNNTAIQNVVKKIDYTSDNIIQITKASTTHLIIYNSSCYDFFLNSDPSNGCIDNIWYNKLTALTVLPFLAYQQPGYSDIEKNLINYYRKIKNTENKLLDYIKEK